jgi:hypothetical protein
MEFLKEIENRIEVKLNNFWFEENTEEKRQEIVKVLQEEFSDVEEFCVICDESNNTKEVYDQNILILDIAVKYNGRYHVNRVSMMKTGSLKTNFQIC